MKNLVILSIVWLLTASAPGQDKITQKLLVHASSSVTINGKTNVNKYRCAIEKYTGNDTLLILAERGKGAYLKNGLVRLNATGFDCGMNAITKDFQESIQSEKYPYIKINFISFEHVPAYKNTEEKFKSNMTITLADVSVPCEIRLSIVKDESNLIHLKGKHTFKFSDFNLTPPSKMGGIIKVHETITVNFHLVLSLL